MENVILNVPEWAMIPFAAMLLCIAIVPLTKLNHWWESNLHKLYVSIALSIPVIVWALTSHCFHQLEHQIVFDYLPFILLLASLFVVTGGIRIYGDLRATPFITTTILAIGFVLASCMGTTGAAMLLIRMLITTVSQRKYKTHTFLFFIAIVANCGGLLSPLGDPPLFLLFQQGAPFTWFLNMAPEWLTTGVILLLLHYVADCYYYKRESLQDIQADNANAERLQFDGLINVVWLLCIILATAFINDTYISVMGAHDAPWYLKLLREWVFIAIIILSLVTTKRRTRENNAFSWTPIIEVAVIFIGIFATMTPALMYLSQQSFHLSEPWQFVYATGTLSAFLDNAPTAMVFHALAESMNGDEVQMALAAGGGDAVVNGITYVAGVKEVLLKAIAMGAVFFGSLTYIGNGPNFMVKTIAQQRGVEMPSFFGYIFKFSLIILLPVFILVQLLYL